MLFSLKRRLLANQNLSSESGTFSRLQKWYNNEDGSTLTRRLLTGEREASQNTFINSDSRGIQGEFWCVIVEAKRSPVGRASRTQSHRQHYCDRRFWSLLGPFSSYSGKWRIVSFSSRESDTTLWLDRKQVFYELRLALMTHDPVIGSWITNVFQKI